MELFDTIIVGSGPAGLSAGLYAARYKLRALILGAELGGETTKAWKIDNYPGVESVDGFELIQRMKQQTEAAGTPINMVEVETIERTGHCFSVTTRLQQQFQSKSVILAQGTLRHHLKLEHEEAFVGKGIHYCVTCDAPLYKDKIIAIVGGGDGAVKGADLASHHAKHVYLIVREDHLNAEPVNQEILKAAKNVDIIYKTEITQLIGDKKLEKIGLSQPYKEAKELAMHGLFIEVGADPNSQLAKSLACKLDEKGYILVDASMKTSIDGIFAAGDTTNFFGPFKQAISAAAMGAVAATSVYEDVMTHKPACDLHAKTPEPIKTEETKPATVQVAPPPLPTIET